MIPRKVVLKEFAGNQKKKVYMSCFDIGPIMCWKDQNRTCCNNCAAWRQNNKEIECMALPTNKFIAIMGEDDDDE